MRIALFAAALCLLTSEAPRAQSAQTVTITGKVQAVQNGAVVKPPVGGLWVYLVDKGAHHRPSTSSATSSGKNPQIRQQHTSFDPHVLVVPKGAIVDFPNDDAYEHNVFSPDPFFDLGRYSKGTKSRKFTTVGEQEIYCDIHKCMWAHVKVVDVPDASWIQPVVNGTYKFDNVAPGKYEVKAWAIASEDVPSDEKTLVPGDTWDVPTLNVQLGALDLNHNNKTNQPYPPSAQQYGNGRCP